MALQTPTTKDINDTIIAELESKLNQTIPLLPKAFNRILSLTLAGVFMTLWKYGGWMFLQIFVQTASYDETEINGKTYRPLEFWGVLIGVGVKQAATQAELLIDILVTNQTGSLPAGTQLVGTANGVTYITLTDTALSAATVQATVRAVSDQQGGGGAGTIGNLDAGQTMNFANPLPNVQRTATVDSQVTTAADAQSVDNYRKSIIDRFQKRKQGGALVDYELWAEEVEGIIFAYPYTDSGCPGQVKVYCEATEASSGSPDGIPTTAQLEDVLESINQDVSGLATRRPANALANTFAITRTAFTVEVVGIDNVDNLTQVEADVTAAVEEYFTGREPFITGVSVLPRKDTIASSSVGGIVSDVVEAAGGLYTDVIVKEGLTTITLRTLGEGEKAKATVSYS